MQLFRLSTRVADNTEFFSWYEKLLCWNSFITLEEELIKEMAKLGTTLTPKDKTINAFEKLLCKLYTPSMTLDTVKKLRWLLFRCKKEESESLPLTQDALLEALLRVHHQTMVWSNGVVANTQIPSPKNYGWEQKDQTWQPVITRLPLAPDAVI